MTYNAFLRKPILNNFSRFHLGVSQVCNFTKQRHTKRYRHPKEDQPAVDYLERILLATGFELHETIAQEKKLRESLTSRELELRGLALRDITLDTNYLNHSTSSGQVEVKLIKSSRLLGGVAWRTGAVVTLQYSKNGDFEILEKWQSVKGLIAHVDSSSLTVRFDSLSNFVLEYFIQKEMDGELRLIKHSKEQIFRSTISSLRNMMSKQLPLNLNTPSGQIFDKILNKNQKMVSNKTEPQRKEQTVTILNLKIKTDASKMRALDMISKCHPLTLIHGPPGTGKTTTLAAAVLSAVLNGDKVLVTASSHAACDAFTMALAEYWPSDLDKKFVRLGNPLRFPNKKVCKYSVDNLKKSPELENILDQLTFTRRQLIDQFKGKADILAEQSNLQKDYYNFKNILEGEAIEESSVVICTVLQSSGLGNYFRRNCFDLFVIDEAGFTPASSILSLIKHAPRLVMAGDHCQLPPITNTEAAQKLGLGVSLFEIMAKSDHNQICVLETQYRSNELICGWSSKYFYDNRIKSSEHVSDILLDDLLPKTDNEKAVTNPLLDTPLLFISTHEQGNWIEDPQVEESVSNCDEAIFVAELVEKFVQLGISQDDICVITPYWAQIMLIRSLLYEGAGYKEVEVRTVDGFQGREKQLVIISMVRSNNDKDLGFLTETRRINVSVTRAQRCCIIVGNASTMEEDAGLSSLINYCKENDSFCTVKQFYHTISRI